MSGRAGSLAGYETVGEEVYKEVDLEELAKNVLLDLIREKIEEDGIEELIDWRHHRIVVKIPLDYFASVLRYEYKRITKR